MRPAQTSPGSHEIHRRAIPCNHAGIRLGCAKQDWIDWTQVTVDVTETWFGSVGGVPFANPARSLWSWNNRHQRSKGLYDTEGRQPRAGEESLAGPIEGTVAGDVFRFRGTRSNAEGEMTASGDEMNGTVSISVHAHSLYDTSIHPPAQPRRPGEPVAPRSVSARTRLPEGPLSPLAQGVRGARVRTHFPVGARSMARGPAAHPVALGRGDPSSEGRVVQLSGRAE